jgi:hypothetical protein
VVCRAWQRWRLTKDLARGSGRYDEIGIIRSTARQARHALEMRLALAPINMGRAIQA